jgi:hypothetical protein
MSRGAPLSFSEGIDGITRRRRAQMRLKGRAVDHINWPSEETGDILFEADVIVDRPFGGGPQTPPICRGHCAAGCRRAQPSRTRRRAPRHARARRSRGDGEWQGLPERPYLKYSTKASQREPWRTAGFQRASKCACVHKRALRIDAGSAQLAADQRFRCLSVWRADSICTICCHRAVS